jgi:hypothetical protein
MISDVEAIIDLNQSNRGDISVADRSPCSVKTKYPGGTVLPGKVTFTREERRLTL